MSRKSVSLLISIAIMVVVSIFHATGHASLPLAASPSFGSQQFRSVSAIPLTLVTMPDEGITPVLNQIAHAQKSIDLVIYELNDTVIEKALIQKQSEGIAVRVLLNGGYYGQQTMNAAAFKALDDAGVPVRYTSKNFALTHQKTIIADGNSALIMTYNFVPKYYKSGRDFGIVDTDAADVSAVERTFDADWNGKRIDAQAGDSLAWSPGAKAVLIGLIDSATSSLLVYNEEMQDGDIVSALNRAADRHVSVSIVMTDSDKWHGAFSDLLSHGVGIHTYAPKASLYIHAKMILADHREAFLGSENFSTNSLDKNRELGLLITAPNVLQAIETTFAADRNAAPAYQQ